MAVLGIDKMIDFSGSVNLGTIGGIILLIIMTGCVAMAALGKNADNKKEDAK